MASYVDMFFEMSDDLFAVIDKDCKLIYANSVWQSLLWQPDFFVKGADFLNFFYADEKKAFIATTKKAKSTHEAQQFFVKLKVHDGSYLSFKSRLVFQEQEQVFVFYGKNQTDNKSLFYSISLNPMCVVSCDGYINSVNPAFKQAFGYEEEELTSRSILELLHQGDINPTAKELNKLSQGETAIRFENHLKTKKGDYRILDWNVVADSMTQNLYCAIHDLTEQRASELKLLQSAKMATLGEMASEIAHEINNPLTIIQGKVALLMRTIEQEKVEKDKIKVNLQRITNTIDRIVKIIRGLRSFSRHSEKDPMTAVDLRLVISEIIDLCADKFKQNNIKLKTDLEENLIVRGRFAQIGQVLINLLNNSFDAVVGLTGDKWVSIEVKKISNKIHVAVIDSGLGISEEVVNQMMNPFFTTKEVGKGTGLGLSISKRIIEDHSGTLYFDEKSLNTRFVIELPSD